MSAASTPTHAKQVILAPTAATITPQNSPTPTTHSRVFVCPEPDCDGRFHRKFTLHEHIKTHTGEKPYQCPITSCGRRFGTSGNLSRHRRLHMEKTILCPVLGCERTFAKPAKFERHLKTHMGTAAHVCSFPGCAKTFSTSGNLLRHQRTQHRNYVFPEPQWYLPAVALPAAQAPVPGATPVGAKYEQIYESIGAAYDAHVHAQPHYSHAMLHQFDAVSEFDVLDLLDSLLSESDAYVEPPKPLLRKATDYCSDDASLRELFVAV